MAGIDDKVGGALDITRRDWTGLPWDVDPNGCRDQDWVRVLPGTYYLEKIESGWVYIRLGGTMVKLDEGDMRAHWPNA